MRNEHRYQQGPAVVDVAALHTEARNWPTLHRCTATCGLMSTSEQTHNVTTQQQHAMQVNKQSTAKHRLFAAAVTYLFTALW